MNPQDYVRLADFKTRELVGTTNSSANTEQLFYHNAGAAPSFLIAVEGAVYVPRHGIGPNTLDVRSTKTSEPFRIILFY